MKYYEILYQNCFNIKHVALIATQDIDKFLEIKSSGFDGIKVIDHNETDFESYRRNKINHFKDYRFSVN